MPPEFSGFICAFHPAAPSSSPKHAIYTFSIYIVQIVFLSFEMECEKNGNKQKEAGMGPFLKKSFVIEPARMVFPFKCFLSSLNTNYSVLNPGANFITNYRVVQIRYAEIKHSDWLFQDYFLPIIVHSSALL